MTERAIAAVDALSQLPDVPRVVTIGNFDGVHRGHQHLLSQARTRARELGVVSLVMTFEPHPTALLRPDRAPRRIGTPADKVARLHAHGIDEVVVLSFDHNFAALSPEQFLKLVIEYARPRAVYVGAGFRFGKMRAGDTEMIARFGHEHGFECHVVEPRTDDEGVISSSRVRDALSNGEMSVANALLGRRFRLSGSVEHGMARGRDLGYPTANLMISDSYCIPLDGIYAGYVRFDGSVDCVHEALVYIGTSPTFGDRDRLVEVNILDYHGDLYGHILEIEFVQCVRGDQVFDSAEALMKQMADDERRSRDVLAGTTPEPAM